MRRYAVVSERWFWKCIETNGRGLLYGIIPEFPKGTEWIRASAQPGESVCVSTHGIPEFELAVLPAAVIKMLVVKHTEESKRYLMDHCYDGAKDFLLIFFSFAFPTDIHKPTQSACRTWRLSLPKCMLTEWLCDRMEYSEVHRAESITIKICLKELHPWDFFRDLAMVDSSWNVVAHGDAREGKWRGNWRMEWVASTLHTTSEHGVCSITTADAHTSAASSRLNW